MERVAVPPSDPTRVAVERFSLTNPQVFSRFYEQTHVAVYRYVYGLHGGPPQEVEDLTAEAFERAWKARRRFKGDENAALGWVLVIARRLVIDMHRRRKRRGVPQDIDQTPLPAPGASPEAHTLARERQRVLLSLFQTLPARQRELLVLRYALGWRVKQIAAHLALPENTISVMIRRTLKHLREEWPEDAHLSEW